MNFEERELYDEDCRLTVTTKQQIHTDSQIYVTSFLSPRVSTYIISPMFVLQYLLFSVDLKSDWIKIGVGKIYVRS